MRVLVACEESQAVCKAFRERGHEAYSADLQECSGGHPEWHIKGDCLPLINGDCTFMTEGGQWVHIEGQWDLLIAHPPCTYLSNAGANSLFKKIDGKSWMNYERYKKGLEGKAFFMKFMNADCERIAIENPIPSSVYELPKYSQTIQPYHFGHPWSKKTCLWLKGLPPLFPTEIVSDYRPYVSSGMYSKTKDPKYKGFSRAGGAQKIRAKTFPGIAKAMAEQWG
jgi:hypothetical protein